MNITFEPLSKENLREAIALLWVIFPDDAAQAEVNYPKSINPTDPYWETRRMVNYYVVRDKDTGNGVALTGLYNLKSYSEDEVWLGWYGVIPEMRGKGIGKKVLQWTMDEARRRGYKKFRLWTTTSPEEITAQKLYDATGIKIYDQKKEEGGIYDILYREINL